MPPPTTRLGPARASTWATITEHHVPTLLLLATVPEDRLALNEGALERFRAEMPEAEVELVDGASHSMITDLRERFGTLVADWLARHVGVA